MKHWFVILSGLCLLLIGILIGATAFENTLSAVLWTDIATFLVAFFGVAFGFFTYFQWLNDKRRDDAYLAAKKYHAAIDEISQYLHELLTQYDHISPPPGTVIETDGPSIKRIEHLHTVWNLLYQARRICHASHRELGFWGARLADRFEEDYKAMNRLLDQIALKSSTLNSQLLDACKDDQHQRKAIEEIVHSKHQFEQLHSELHQILQRSLRCDFKELFRFDY